MRKSTFKSSGDLFLGSAPSCRITSSSHNLLQWLVAAHFLSNHVLTRGVATCHSFPMQVPAKADFEKSRQEVALNHIAMEMFSGEGGDENSETCRSV